MIRTRFRLIIKPLRFYITQLFNVNRDKNIIITVALNQPVIVEVIDSSDNACLSVFHQSECAAVWASARHSVYVKHTTLVCLLVKDTCAGPKAWRLEFPNNIACACGGYAHRMYTDLCWEFPKSCKIVVQRSLFKICTFWRTLVECIFVYRTGFSNSEFAQYC